MASSHSSSRSGETAPSPQNGRGFQKLEQPGSPSAGQRFDVDDDACTNACELTGCGDGVVQGDEESLRQVSDTSHVHKDTIHKFENGANVHDRTRHDLRRAFETAGVEFVLGDKRETCQISLPDGWIVRLKPED